MLSEIEDEGTRESEEGASFGGLTGNVAQGCSPLWHQSNFGARQTWLLHRAEKTECVCLCVRVRARVCEWEGNTAFPSPPTALYSHIQSAAGTASLQSLQRRVP